MSARYFSQCVFGLVGLWLTALPACLNNASVPPLSPAAQGVRIDSGDPPRGARLVGPISATHGNGCGIANQRGTEEGATAALREAAARRGASFVKITKTIKPYPGHDCFHQEFTLEGLGYSIDGVKPAAAATPVRAAMPPPVTSAPALAEPVAAPTSTAASQDCAPPCSPGYACHAGVCEAECNPPCTADQTCRTDRICVPRAAKAPAE